MAGLYAFPPTMRLRSKADFAAMRRGKRLQSHGLRLIWRRNGLAHARIGFAVSRKYGNSVARHRFKRHVREIFRQHPLRHQGVDILVIPLGQEAVVLARQVSLQHCIRELFNRLLLPPA